MQRSIALWTCGVALLVQLASPIAAQNSGGIVLPPPGTPARLGELTPTPQKTRHVEPIYPEAARAKGLSGVVIVEFVIGTTGRVRNIRVLRSARPFDRAAINAIRQWRYKTTLLNGEPVSVLTTVSVQFPKP